MPIAKCQVPNGGGKRMPNVDCQVPGLISTCAGAVADGGDSGFGEDFFQFAGFL
jgi:hypothetical protein